jgi:pyridoxamine 5'-phosphate oxidase
MSVIDPWPLVIGWIEDAKDDPHGTDMVLATATTDGVPSARVVSLRGHDARGLWFFTHDGSRKTTEIAANARVALVLHWAPRRRQLRIDGVVEPLDRDHTVRYFATRPRAAQISAVVSRQGRPRPDDLRAQHDALTRELAGAPVPCPDDFVGFRVVPHAIELFEAADDRMHERTAFIREGDAWRSLRLSP